RGLGGMMRFIPRGPFSMYTRLTFAAALLAAGLITVHARDRASADAALTRAALAWDKGDYISALTDYQALLSAGAASGAGRLTRVRTIAAPTRNAATLDGGEASFCPDGRRVAFLRVPASPEIAAAQLSLAGALTAAERAPRQQALARLVARTGRIVMRDLESGRDEELNT